MVDSSNSSVQSIDGERNAKDVLERLPEIRLIDDNEIRAMTVDAASRGIPDYFWSVPATSSGHYHNPFTRQVMGLWIHTKQVCTVYERTVRSYEAQGLIDSYEADAGRAACVLHDMLKYGHEYEDGDGTKNNHDALASMWLKNNTEVPEETVSAVDSHNGFWYEGCSPSSDLDQLVHMADMVASTKNVTVGVYEPHEKIEKKYPNLPRATF